MKVSLNSSQSLPTEFIQRLQHIVPQEFSESVLQSFSQESLITLRINELRSSIDEMKQLLREKQIHFQEIAWFKEALVMDNLEYQKILELGWIEKGMLYRQNLSSMLVGRVIAPKSGEDVLDLCAAPGSKATHMAALMNNSGELVVVESVRSRFYRLKSVAELLGVENMKFVYCDGRRYRFSREMIQHNFEGFDRVLVDAPCSSEGRFNSNDAETYQYWSLRKIKEMVRKQRGLIHNALKLVKPGGILVYSTCTFAPEENEGVINWLLDKEKNKCQLLEIPLRTELSADNGKCSSGLTQWGKRVYNDQVRYCLRIWPDSRMEGFFIALLKKAE